MKIGDLVYYRTPIGLPDDSPLGIVIDLNEEKDTAYIAWVTKKGTDPMPIKWLEVIQTSKSET